MILWCLFVSGLDCHEIIQFWKLEKCNFRSFLRFCTVFDLDIVKFHISRVRNEPRDKLCALTKAATLTLVNNIP